MQARQLCGLRIRIKTIESIWKHYQRGTPPPPPLGIEVLCGEINGSPEFNSSFILLLLRSALKKCNVQSHSHCSCSRTMKCISFSTRSSTKTFHSSTLWHKIWIVESHKVVSNSILLKALWSVWDRDTPCRLLLRVITINQ